MSDVIEQALIKYYLQLQSHPLRTKAITAGVITGCSDAIAQKISGVKNLQIKRLFLVTLFGFVYGGPCGHFLHKLMDKIFTRKKDNKTVAKKVLVEQIMFSAWNNFLFIVYYGLVVEGRPWNAFRNKLSKDFLGIQFKAWMFWPIIGWVNQQQTPWQFRDLFSSSFALWWYVFLNVKARSIATKVLI